ncbi:hypothetical protein [Bdellovibrio sp.]|uniref:hypothetical protein n=1 Tax=Bdellovibrio sp. TaxID=28201 RepID=UPI0039E455DB
MNLRLDSKDIRIRLSEREWSALNEHRQLQQKFDLGLKQDLAVTLRLSDHNGYGAENFQVHIFLDQAALQKPLRKKDPYWIYVNEKGVQLSLDVDIIPEEKR